MEEGTILYLCSVAPLLYLLSDLLPPPPLPNVQYVQTVCDWGGGVLKCTVDHILQGFFQGGRARTDFSLAWLEAA
jgi:hypothetical protein